MLDQEAPALYVEPDGRLVEQQKPRIVDKGPNEFDPAAQTARQLAHLVVPPIGKIRPRELLLDAGPRAPARHPAQRRVVKQVLLDTEVKVERRLLEHHAEQCQRVERFAPDIVPVNTDCAAGAVI